MLTVFLKQISQNRTQLRGRLRALVAMLVLGIAVSAQTFTHSVGKQSTSLGENGMQVVHEYRQVVYLKPGATIQLKRPDFKTFRQYIRWYDYSTDAAATNLTVASGALTTTAGSFYFVNATELIASYKMPNDGLVHYIACDQSAYADYQKSQEEIVEPTLSQRLVFEIRPAAEMASLLDEATGDKWLETYDMIAPVGNRLYIGPKYGFRSGAAYINYFYNASNPTQIACNEFKPSTTVKMTPSNWKATASPASVNSYVCLEAYAEPEPITASLTSLAKAGNGTRKDSKSVYWTIQNIGTDDRSYSLAIPSYRTVTKITVELSNKISGESSYQVNINGTLATADVVSGKNTNKTCVFDGLNISGENLSINVTNNNISVNTITIVYSNSYSVGDVVSSEPAPAYRFWWKKCTTQNGDFTEKRTFTHTTTEMEGWRWTIDDTEDKQPSVSSGQFLAVSSESVGQHTYHLIYNTGKRVLVTTTDTTRVLSGVYRKNYLWNGSAWVQQNIEDERLQTDYTVGSPASVETIEPDIALNVAKFTVRYMEKTEIGPSLNLVEGNRIKSSTLLSERRFNDLGNTFSSANSTYLLSPITASECSYGFYWGTDYRAVSVENYGRVVRDEYALVNNAKELSWYMGSVGIDNSTYLKNHCFSNESDDLPGYMLYVDGSAKPGEVMSLSTKANLCPGSKMFFSAYVADLSTKGQSAPNLDFILIGIDADQNEHVLTTYTTGEFGYNGKDGKNSSAQWLRILFPFEFGDDVDYASYRLKITNKGKSGDGNDFAIDDIQIYVQNPPVMPIQASTVACPVNGVSDTYAYLRVDYGAINASAAKFYYQWRDYEQHVIDSLDYLNGGRGANYGQIVIVDDPVAEGLAYSDIAAFDEEVQSAATPRPTYGYVREACSDGVERYVLYIAQPMNLVVNNQYFGYVAADQKELGPDNNCSASAELMVAAGVTFKMGENVISNGETKTVCGSEPGTLQMVYRYIQRDTEGGKLTLIELTNVKADWIYGDADYVNAHPGVYMSDYATISAAINHYRNGDADAEQSALFEMLVKNGLLIPSSSAITPNLIGVGSSDTVAYTAFPIVASIESLVNDKVLCAEPSTFYFRLGDEAANAITIASSEDGDSELAWAELPLYVRINPRRIRVSENDVLAGNAISTNIHLIGSERSYACSQAVLVATTNPDAAHLVSTKHINLTFTGNSDSQLINANTTGMTIAAGATGLQGLKAGYDYTFRLEKVRLAGDVDDCSDFNTFFTFRIVPAVVTWTGAYGDAWNNDYNWDTFAPMADTKVVLSAGDHNMPASAPVANNVQREAAFEDGAAAYITYDINYAVSECADLYIPQGATLVNQHRLTVNGKVYFDMPVEGGKWTLSSLPIQGVVAGDIYVPVVETAGDAEPFSVTPMNQTIGQTATDRSSNKIYASLFNQKATLVGTGKSELTSASFTGTINDVTQTFPTGMGFSLKADFTGQKVIRLPKQEDSYYYYDQSGCWIDWYENISRDANYGKPAYMPTGTDGAEGMNITLTNNTEGEWFLFGNPTFANIDIKQFIAGNSSVLSGAFAMVDVKNRNAIIYASRIGDTYAFSNPKLNSTTIPVGCSMLFQVNAKAQALTLNLTPDMLVPNKEAAGGAKHVQGLNDNKEIAISLRHNSITSSSCYISHALLKEDDAASDMYVEGEDVETILMEPAKTRFAIYTTADNKACAINHISSQVTTVPLAVYSTYTGTISKEYLCFEGNDDYLSEWDLVSLSDGSRIQLYDSLTLKVVMPMDGSVDYVLEHARKAPAVPTGIDQLDYHLSYSVYTSDGYLMAYSNEDMHNLFIYDASGRLVAQETNAGTTAQFRLPSGVYMVRANGQTTKAIVK